MELTTKLKSLVHFSVSLLGQVIERELGPKKFQQIESLRQNMARLRSFDSSDVILQLEKNFLQLQKLGATERFDIAKSFTLMLELINSCENAYRSHRLALKINPLHQDGLSPISVTYVLTAHPTEARAPQNIEIFHRIQKVLNQILNRLSEDDLLEPTPLEKNQLLHLLEVAWRTPIVRARAPKVKDEAEHVYSLLLRDEVLFHLLDLQRTSVPFFVRSWVGGDKDGHPGVDEKVLLQSLNLSRKKILQIVFQQLEEFEGLLNLFPSEVLHKKLMLVKKLTSSLRVVRAGDSNRLIQWTKAFFNFEKEYLKELSTFPEQVLRLRQIFATFPGLVVPLELRESSDVLMSKPAQGKKLAIDRMLATLALVSKGGDPQWYARGFIISMCESMVHIRAAANKQKQAFGDICLPVIPLFEEASSLADAPKIMLEMTNDAAMKKACQKNWGGLLEMMVGYSDSAKEAGVLPSRLAIAKALPELEKVCQRSHLIPVFFHGSGGSADRGGGSIEDQTAWWPKSALSRYKVTVQGEMIERSLATPAIAQRQVEKIIESAQRGLQKKSIVTKSAALDRWAERISAYYQKQINSVEFLKIIELATPYSYLSILKIGSRPAKRTQQLTVKNLRAIPWVLCWTQTRVLFPTWWGVGSAWSELSAEDKRQVKDDFKTQPVLTSYIKVLGFTLAKIELGIWWIYLQQSSLAAADAIKTFETFQSELEKTIFCYRQITEQNDFMWYRPWLGESIQLRSPMIHPLNLLQILAKKDHDVNLLRLTVTGISSGMLTTG